MGEVIFDAGTLLFIVTFIIILVDLRGESEMIHIEKEVWKYVLAFALAFIYPITLPLYIVRWLLITKNKNQQIASGDNSCNIQGEGNIVINNNKKVD